jgi:hypothetical protein
MATVLATQTTDLASPAFVPELLAALDSGIDLELYLTARTHGISAAELHAAHASKYPLKDYLTARTAGATPAQFAKVYLHLLPSAPTAITPSLAHTAHYYALARRVGVSHAAFRTAQLRGLDLAAYTLARRAGATHHELIAAHAHGDLEPYANARQAGTTHAEYKEATALGVPLVRYTAARYMGLSHEAALDNW